MAAAQIGGVIAGQSPGATPQMGASVLSGKGTPQRCPGTLDFTRAARFKAVD
jgi:hypothetical protein